MDQLPNMTAEMLAWIRQHLPDHERDPLNTCIKMSEEVAELTHALYTGDGDVGEECADVLILLLDVAFLKGIDLEFEFIYKMNENRGRKWNREKGCLKHEQG